MMIGLGMGLGGIGLVLMLIFWGGLIFGGVWLVKTVFASGQQNSSGIANYGKSSPRDILDKRYARGEITREQYEIMKNDVTE